MHSFGHCSTVPGARPAPAASNAPCACGRLRRASRALTQLYDDALAPSGLLVTQFSLLRTLARVGPSSVSALAAATLTDRSALSRNLAPLAARGLVVDGDGADGRARIVALSPAGRRALTRALPHWRRAQRAVRHRLGPERLHALIDTLALLESMHPGTALPAVAALARRIAR